MLQGPPLKLSVRYQIQGEGTVVEVVGELHLPSVAQFEEPLKSIVSDHLGTVMLDFRRVIFIDSAGLKALVDVRKQLSLQSRRLSLYLVAGSQPDQVICTSRLNTIIALTYENDERPEPVAAE